MFLSEELTKLMPGVDTKQAMTTYLDKLKSEQQDMGFQIDSAVSLIKSEDDGEEYYEVAGYVSTYGNVDKGQDRVRAGAFDKDLMARGDERTILWQHDRNQPIGKGKFRSDKKGLFATIRLPKADDFVTKRVYPQLKIGSVKEFSMGYYLKNYTITEENDRVVYNLDEIEINEASIVTFPMNSECKILTVKSEIIDEMRKELQPVKPILPTYEAKYACLEDNYIADADAFDDMADFIKENAIPESDVFFKQDDKCFYFAGIKNGEIVIVPSRLAEAVGFVTDIAEKAVINAYFKKLGKEVPFNDDGTLFINRYTLRHLGKKALSNLLFADGVVLSNNVKDALVEAASTTSELGEKHEPVENGADYDIYTIIANEFKKLEK